MPDIRSVVAITKRQLDQCCQLRSQVFEEEERLLCRPSCTTMREVSVFDTLDTAIQLLAYADRVPAGTLRLMLPNPQVAGANGYRYGFPLEQLFTVTKGSPVGVAEVSRFCILRCFRGKGVHQVLSRKLREECNNWGIWWLLGASNMHTDALEDATLDYTLAGRLGLVSDEWQLRPRNPGVSPASPRVPRYSPDARQLARVGKLERQKLPPTPSFLVRTQRALFAGPPAYDPIFHRCAAPMVITLDDTHLTTRYGSRSDY